MFKEQDIILELGDYFVLRLKSSGHYEILRNTGTHSVRVATVHYSNDDPFARARAIEQCKNRYNHERGVK